MTYNLRILRPAPSMSQDRVVFEAASYQEAVQVAHDAFRQHRRSVSLGSGEYGMENWHRVDDKGLAVDRNFNSGIPPLQQLST